MHFQHNTEAGTLCLEVERRVPELLITQENGAGRKVANSLGLAQNQGHRVRFLLIRMITLTSIHN